MTNDKQILERLDRIEAQLSPISQTAQGLKEIRDDLIPLSGQAFRLIIRELEDVESSFQLEDLLALAKRFLRSVKHLQFSLAQLENIVDFVMTIEPLLKSAVPKIINYLDDLEQRGILRIIQSTLDVRAKIAASYSPEDVEQIGDGLVAMLGVAQKLSDPRAQSFLKKMATLPSKVDLEGAKPVGPFGMIGALSGKQARQGLGILMELTKAMGELKNGGGSSAAPESEPIA
jgi:uncharacterized protein YjgD (DUF1641 family)